MNSANMILLRRNRPGPTTLAVTLIALSILCHKQAISISDQQQQQAPQIASEIQQKQPSLAQTQATGGPSPKLAAAQVTNITKSSMTAEHSADQSSTQAPSGGRNNKPHQQARHSNSAGKVRKSTPTKLPGNEVRASAPSTNPDQSQDEAARLSMIYQNTPPLFVTPTRDFYVDVARHAAGFKLTTVQAIDMEGDQIEYSLKPAKFLDASPYFTINATSGDLRFTGKQILEPKLVEEDSDDDLDDTSGNIGERLRQEQRQELQVDNPGFLYFLNVAAWDGQYTSVIELKIHVSNLTHFGASSPVRLTPEGGFRGAESLMRAKTGEFLSSLYSSSATQRRAVPNNSTIVLPSFVNPPLLSAAPLDVETKPADELNPAQAHRPAQRGDTRQAGTEGYGLDSNQPRNVIPSNQLAPESLFQQPISLATESPAAATNHKQHSTSVLLVQQPMLLSIIMVVFACLVIAFVLLVFIVPISVKRLKKRLKTMERQHEQLSQKASNGGSSIIGSCLSHGGSLTANSMSINGSSRDGVPSSLSQFTLNSSDRSRVIMDANGQLRPPREPLDRRSSLDSVLTNHAENYGTSQMASSNQFHSYLTAAQHHQRAMMMLASSNGNQLGDVSRQTQGHAHSVCPMNHYNFDQQSLTNNGLNRINNGAIVNPIYLHQLGATSGHDINNSNNKTLASNIYCPIDDEFYSTINTDSTLIDEEIATHNYNLYTRQRDATNQLEQAQTLGHIVGQTSGLSSYVGTGSAHPAALQRQTDSPTQSISSRSSTRSLARFLSLPARHWSHQQEANDPASKHRKSALLDELQFEFGVSGPDANEPAPQIGDPMAKTIARVNDITREQQVRHKRDKSQNLMDDHWEIERHKLRFLNILDEGQFGLVWRCKLKRDGANDPDASGLTVAVKTLKSFAAKDIRERDELLAEIEIMKLVCNHPNVVRILHCCTRDIGPTRPILLVMEHVELGKLQSFLEKSRNNHQYATSAGLYNEAGSRSLQFASNGLALGRDYRAESVASSASILGEDDEHAADKQCLPSSAESIPRRDHQQDNVPNQLTSRDLIKFIYHVAKGMEHISSNCIVHRDLASRNILIDSQRVCKIGDFGMARHMENMGDVYERHSRNTKVPVRWMAPEVLLENSFTTKSDVFSFGILMWEIVTLGSTPYRHLKTDQIIQAVARDGQRPERPEYCHELLYNIMSSCWSHEPNRRPTFQELVVKLDGLLMSTEEYIQLDQYPDHNYYNISQTLAPFELL